MSSIFFGLTETELRDICRHHIDTFESWSRRLIDEQFRVSYGDKYFDHMFSPDRPLVKNTIKSKVDTLMAENPGRFPRKIDAIFIENIEYFFCRDDLYAPHFKQILETFFSGQTEVRSVLGRIVAIRNKLSHGNTISHHEAEQCICYTNDFIGVYKVYYEHLGRGKDYNVPVFLRIKDSLGHDIVREYPSYYWEVRMIHPYDYLVKLRSGEEYKLWVEVDNSFDERDYDVSWKIVYDFSKLVGEGAGTEIVFRPENNMVSFRPSIFIKLRSRRDWHRFASIGCDDYISIELDEVLPPIEDA